MDKDIKEQFKEPPEEYSAVPFWFWNGTLKPDRLREQMRMMKEQGIYGAFMHARAYLTTPYLEEEWWDMIAACMEEAKAIGFKLWLYDEYAWPSGTAGSTFEYGFQKPSRILTKSSNMAKRLEAVYLDAASEEELAGELTQMQKDGELLGLYLLKGVGDAVQITQLADISGLPVSFYGRTAEKRARLAGFFIRTDRQLVDYLNAETIREFLDITHEQYKERFGEYFGSLIPGIFFDEIYMTRGDFVWTESFPEVFASRHHYKLQKELPRLLEEGAKGEKVREDYYDTAAYLYEKAFFEQIADWCEKNGLMLTGHTEEELPLHPNRQGNYFKTMHHLQIPGADCHDYRYRLPRKISFHESKYAVSVARAYGKKRAMSEAMGGAGWGCSLQEYRRGMHTLGAMGINMYVLHGMYYECDHQGSQADWPASFFYQNPYWKYFRYFADELRRICFMNAIGQPVVSIGIYYPIRDMQRHSVCGRPDAAALRISESFHRALYTLIEQQMDTDMLDEDTLLSSEIENGCLLTGGRSVRVILFPAAGNISGELGTFIEKFSGAGGRVLFYTDRKADKSSIGGSSVPTALVEELPGLIEEWIGRDIKILEGDASEIYVSHRRLRDTEYYFISNSEDRRKDIKVWLSARGRIERLNTVTGDIMPVDARDTEDGSVVRLSLKEDEACYLLVSPEKSAQSSREASVGLRREGYRIVPGKWTFLPLSRAYDRRFDDEAQETELSLPIALLSSPLHADAMQIRVCNTVWENGCCGRHLSLWSGAWITRRPHWQDDTREADLYFRRSVYLKEKPARAELCIAAVKHVILYINGERVWESDGMEPFMVEAGKYFQKGDNLIAVHVHNPNPYQDSNFSSTEILPKDRMISLLFEARFSGVDGDAIGVKSDSGGREDELCVKSDAGWIVTNRPVKGWESPSCHPAAAVHDPSCHQKPAIDGEWLYAWERGKPPIHPWGDLPWFGKEIPWPLELVYQVILPVGTAGIYAPQVKGEYVCKIDGRRVDMEDGKLLALTPESRTRVFELSVLARGADYGLQKPICVRLKPVAVPYGEWASLGLSWFSGRAIYRNHFELEEKGHYRLTWGQSNSCAEIWINHILAGVCAWAPYEVDITDYVREGENEIAIVIANLAAPERRVRLVDEGMALGWNRYWNEDNIDRESEDLVSGLMGPVRIYRYV